MNIPFLDNWRKRYGPARGPGLFDTATPEGQAGIAELLAECDLLRALAEGAGVELSDTAESLEALDQLLPRWREDPEVTPWLGNDAGLYLGTVIARTVPGAHWVFWPNGQPVVELSTGREIDVVEMGQSWAVTGTPELSQLYAEVSES